MTMTAKTVAAIETARKLFGDREFKDYEWTDKYQQGKIDCTLRTALAHGVVEKIVKTARTEWTVDELINFINDLDGECYFEQGYNLVKDPDGRIYDVYTVTNYRFKKVEE